MSELNKTLADVFGYTSFRPGQEEVINHLMQKNTKIPDLKMLINQIGSKI